MTSAARPTRRSHPPRFRALLLVLLTNLAAAWSIAAPVAQGVIPVDPRPSVAILIDGLCSSRPPASDILGSFDRPGGIVNQLNGAGWTADSILAYSYRGGVIDASGSWAANGYTCADTFSQGIRGDAEVLDAQIHAILAARPNTDIHLVGFSLGGLIAMAYLAQLAGPDAWTLPANGRLVDVVTLDAPLGGVPYIVTLCKLTPASCGGSTSGDVPAVIADLGSLWDHGSGTPAGATRSVERLFGGSRANQALADAARDRGVRVLTVGNVRDWTYAPTTSTNFQDTQWLVAEAIDLAVYSRVITSGPAVCPDAPVGDPNPLAGLDCNHALVLSDPQVVSDVVALFGGGFPGSNETCSPGIGNCMSLPPLHDAALRSGIAAGVVRPTAKFTTGLVTVAKGSRVTLRFTMSPSLPGVRIEIWARSRTGSYHRLTTRLADSAGVVMYAAPPVTAWTAYQARFAGDQGTARAISPARVATIR